MNLVELRLTWVEIGSKFGRDREIEKLGGKADVNLVDVRLTWVEIGSKSGRNWVEIGFEKQM